MPQGLQQPFIVSLMEANGRFVQHVAAAHQTRSHLGGQTNALGFAARKGVGRAIQGEIPEAHGLHEAKSGFHFLQDGGGNSIAFLAQREVVEVRHCIHDGHRGNFGDVGAFSAQTHAQGCGLQSLAATSFARCGTHVALQTFFHRIAFGFVVAAFQAGDHAGPDNVANVPAVHQNFPHFGGELRIGKMTVQSTCVAELPHHAGVPTVHAGTIFSPRLNGFGVTHRRIWDHQLLVVFEHAAKTFADRARPERTVEREHPRFEFGQRAFRVQLAGKGFTERVVGPLAVVFHAGNQ